MTGDISFYRHSEKENLTVREAGKLGGLTLLLKHGKSHFTEIGRKGQMATRAKYPEMASAWGKLGGRPRKLNLNTNMGEPGEK
jgi:general stress protein YciG